MDKSGLDLEKIRKYVKNQDKKKEDLFAGVIAVGDNSP